MPDRGSSVERMRVTEWQDGRQRQLDDDLICEAPLEIRVNGAPVSVTLRTPGADAELAAGFLFTEGVVTRREHLAGIGAPEAAANGDVIDVTLPPDVPFDVERLRRHFYATSSCGVCGKASLDAVRLRGLQAPSRGFRLSADVLCALPDTLRASQALFGRTGALHAAALFDDEGRLLALREDVGRHNAVDKIVGHALLQGRLPLERQVLLVSGRGGFELVQKALTAGVAVMASVSAPSSLSVRLAREFGLTLVGFLRGRRFIVYAGDERIVPGVDGD